VTASARWHCGSFYQQFTALKICMIKPVAPLNLHTRNPAR